MAARRDPVERIVDLVVGVPIAIAAAVRELVPVDLSRVERAIGRNLGLIARARRGGSPASAPVRASSADPAVVVAADTAPADTSSVPVAGVAEAARVDAHELPIDGYDQLSARQIVELLDGLTADELAAVGAYESANRRRQTILARIEQGS